MKSSVYLPRPVMKRTSSLRVMGLPMYVVMCPSIIGQASATTQTGSVCRGCYKRGALAG